jgi:ribosomal protein S3
MGHLVNPVSFRIGFSRDWGFSGALMESKQQYFYLNSFNWNIFIFFKRFFLLNSFFRAGLIFSHVKSIFFGKNLKIFVYYYDGPLEADSFLLYRTLLQSSFFKILLKLNKFFCKYFFRKYSEKKYFLAVRVYFLNFLKILLLLNIRIKKFLLKIKIFLLLKKFSFFYKIIFNSYLKLKMITSVLLIFKLIFDFLFLGYLFLFLALKNKNLKVLKKILLKYFFLIVYLKKQFSHFNLNFFPLFRNKIFKKSFLNKRKKIFFFKILFSVFQKKIQNEQDNFRLSYFRFLEKYLLILRKGGLFKYFNFKFFINFFDNFFLRYFFATNLILRKYFPILFKNLSKDISVRVSFNIVSKYQITASIVSRYICIRLKQGFALMSVIRPVLKDLSFNHSVIGFKISCCGRFTKKEIATFFWKRQRQLSTNTITALIDYSLNEVVLKYSLCGIKVWIQRKIPTKYLFFAVRNKYFGFFENIQRFEKKEKKKNKIKIFKRRKFSRKNFDYYKRNSFNVTKNKYFKRK